MKRLIVAISILAVVAAAIALLARARAARDGEQSSVELATVERGAVRKTVTADGVLQPLTSVNVKSDVGGRIEVLAVDVGDKVKKGDLIARIDPTESQTAYDQAMADLVVARADLAQAREQCGAETELTRTSIAQAQAGYDAAVDDLARVQRAAHPQTRAAARSTLDKAAASLEAARKDLERLQTASQPQARAQARAALDKATASLEAEQKGLQRLKEAAHPTARVDTATGLDKARSDLDVAEKELQRARGLRADGLIPQSELEVTESKHEAAKAAFASAKERADTLAADQSAELRAGEARVRQAEAELASAQKCWDTIDAGQAAELESARQRVAQAEADWASAQQRWETLDQEQGAELKAAQAKVAQMKAALEHARADAVQERVRRAQVTSAAAKLRRAEAAVEDTRTTLSYATVRAPRDGVILQKFVEEGTIVTSASRGVMEGMNIVELGDLTRMFVDVEIDESDLADLRVGQSAEIHVEAFPDDAFRGIVTRRAPQALTTQSITTVLVEIEIQDRDPRLMPGLSATCDFLVAEAKDTLYVPSRAVRKLDRGDVVTVASGGQLVPVPVEVGLRGDERTEILRGLEQGDRVVVPELGAPPGAPPDIGREMGRRMGGAGGFVK